VVLRAEQVLAEREKRPTSVGPRFGRGKHVLEAPTQLTIFTPLSQPVVERLREVDLDRLTPIEALNLLAELKRQLE
jgi:DNA mismatch repair protein MutS